MHPTFCLIMRATARVVCAARAMPVPRSAAARQACAIQPYTTRRAHTCHQRHHNQRSRGGHSLLHIAAFGPFFWAAQQPTAYAYVPPSSTASPAAPTGQQDPAGPRFRLHRVVGDGACMFRAVVQAAHHAATGVVLESDAESTAALELRRACVQELSKRRE